MYQVLRGIRRSCASRWCQLFVLRSIIDSRAILYLPHADRRSETPKVRGCPMTVRKCVRFLSDKVDFASDAAHCYDASLISSPAETTDLSNNGEQSISNRALPCLLPVAWRRHLLFVRLLVVEEGISREAPPFLTLHGCKRRALQRARHQQERFVS